MKQNQRAFTSDVRTASFAQREGPVPTDSAAIPKRLLSLQGSAGNQAVSRLIQTKLLVGPDGDAHEQEADRVASDFSGNRSRKERRVTQPPGQVQHAPRDVELGIEQARGGGRPLPTEVRGEMEEALGLSFADVRVHTGSAATGMSSRLAARAFTTGTDIFVRDGEPGARSAEGRSLIAHELAHVVQQTMGNSGKTRLNTASMGIGGSGHLPDIQACRVDPDCPRRSDVPCPEHEKDRTPQSFSMRTGHRSLEEPRPFPPKAPSPEGVPLPEVRYNEDSPEVRELFALLEAVAVERNQPGYEPPPPPPLVAGDPDRPYNVNPQDWEWKKVRDRMDEERERRGK